MLQSAHTQTKWNIYEVVECKTHVHLDGKIRVGAVWLQYLLTFCIISLKKQWCWGAAGYQASQPQLEEFQQNSEETCVAIRKGGNAAQDSIRNSGVHCNPAPCDTEAMAKAEGFSKRKNCHGAQ